MVNMLTPKYNFLFFLLFLSFPFITHTQTLPSPLDNSFKSHVVSMKNSLFQMDWISVGPVLNSARVEAIQADPNTPGTMFAAFGSGNLWKTTNNGLNWIPIFENQPALGIGDIALAPSDPNIIYLGTGESLRKNRNYTMPGNGVYKSEDSGKTWKHLGLENSWHIGEIAVHPENPDIVFVAVLGKFWTEDQSKGLYRTTNGGKSWKRVLYVDENTRANDVVIAQSDPDIVYASMWENNLDSTLMESVYGPNSGIYKSEDGGEHWKKIKNGLPKQPKIGRIGLAVSCQDPQKVYALIDNRNKKNANMAEVYKTIDGGQSWTRTHDKELNIFSVIGWYFADIYVNPQNDEEIFGLGVRLAHSEDGGKNFDLLEGRVEHLHPSPAQTLHLDHCEIWINPLNPQHLIVGNDGGVYQTYDKGQTWLHLNNIPSGEFYDITLDNQNPYNIYGGTQDNATVYGPAKEWTSNLKDPWKYLWIDAWSGGDGCVTQVDPEDPNTVYLSSQEGYVRRMDMKADTLKTIAPKSHKSYRELLQYQFVAPYFISPHRSKTLYHAGNYVLKSMDRGENWNIISPDLTKSSDLEKESFAAGNIAESKLQPGLLFVGMDKGVFWCSKDDGQNWQEYSNGLPPYYIRSICPSVFKKSRAYLAMTGINDDVLSKYLFVSEDYGQNWRSIASDLPDEPVNVILEDPFYENILYAGVYRGVYISMDRGKSWNWLGKNMPAVSIGDMEIQEREKDLVVGTHGRGIYYINLQPIYDLVKMDTLLHENVLFEIPDARYPKRRASHGDIDKSSVSKIPISFWLKKNEKIDISIFNSENERIWNKKIEARKGLNQFTWDMIIERRESSMPYYIHYDKYINPGVYKVEMKASEKVAHQELKVLK
ncbi:MAG: hypothetical protein GY705_22210 [Bacteroidetes bacterium]|nr:hypothetical protein [Bacteroidota bacterium]